MTYLKLAALFVLAVVLSQALVAPRLQAAEIGAEWLVSVVNGCCAVILAW